MKIEFDKTTEDGFRLLVIFQEAGYRCGYVGLPEDHCANGFNYYEDNMQLENAIDYDKEKLDIQIAINNIKAHGWLTYSQRNEKIWKDDRWYFGFDCAHFGDAKDFDTAFEYFKDEPNVIKNLKIFQEIDDEYPTYAKGTIKTLNYVINEVESLYEQLKKIKC